MSEDPKTYRVADQDLPLDEIGTSATELIELYGGRVEATKDGSIEFNLPSRRGVAAAGSIRCTLSWTDMGSRRGDIAIETGDHVPGPGVQHVFLLVAGIVGSFVAMLWPFFPSLTPASGVGAIIAFTAYLLTLRRSGANVVQDLFNQLVEGQLERDKEGRGTEDVGRRT